MWYVTLSGGALPASRRTRARGSCPCRSRRAGRTSAGTPRSRRRVGVERVRRVEVLRRPHGQDDRVGGGGGRRGRQQQRQRRARWRPPGAAAFGRGRWFIPGLLLESWNSRPLVHGRPRTPTPGVRVGPERCTGGATPQLPFDTARRPQRPHPSGAGRIATRAVSPASREIGRAMQGVPRDGGDGQESWMLAGVDLREHLVQRRPPDGEVLAGLRAGRARTQARRDEQRRPARP